MSSLRSGFELGSRVLLSSLFLVSGLGKITAYADTAAYMDSAGVPSGLLPAVIALEVGGAIALIAGWKVRWVSAALAAFTFLAAALFHFDFSDEIQTLMLLKNLTISGGLAMLALHGAGPLSVDQWRAQVRCGAGTL